MLHASDYEELAKIAEKANDFLYEHECLEFYIIGINWDDEKDQWLISYQSNYSNHEFINVSVTPVDNGYTLCGHSFELIEVKFP